MINPDVYCSLPYSSVVINPDGSYRLCSLTNGFKFDMGGCRDPETNVEMNVMTHSFAEAMNSKNHHYLRKMHIAGEKSEMCECCYNRDRIGGDSRRTHLIKFLPSVSPDYVNIKTAEQMTDQQTGKFNGPLISLDLRFGNLCNLACVTCGPWYSDKWYEDYKAINKTSDFLWNGKTINIADSKRLGEVGGGTNPWWESDVWWSRFDDALPNLRHLYVTAGEPLLVKAFQTMLQRLVDSGHAKNVIIELDTNLSALNPKIIDLWSKFKRIDLRVSVDELGKKYEVFRYPGKWSTLDNNIKELVGRKYENVDMLLTTCITPLNVFSIADIEQYSRNVGIKRPAHFRFVDSPAQLDIRKLSKTKKDFIIEFLSKVENSRWGPKVIQYLNQHRETYSQHVEYRFVDYMNQLDELRGHDWKNTFPTTALLYNLP